MTTPPRDWRYDANSCHLSKTLQFLVSGDDDSRAAIQSRGQDTQIVAILQCDGRQAFRVDEDGILLDQLEEFSNKAAWRAELAPKGPAQF